MTAHKGKTHSILPNSSAAILAPMPNGLQTRWYVDLDLYVLYHGETHIAGHQNGFSCHNLAVRMLAGDMKRTLEQFDYIAACGGRHYMTRDEFCTLAATVRGMA